MKIECLSDHTAFVSKPRSPYVLFDKQRWNISWLNNAQFSVTIELAFPKEIRSEDLVFGTLDIREEEMKSRYYYF
jgi:hypothetical protein